MKFSPDVNHKPVVNWWKNFGHSTIDMSATPLFVSKLWERLAPVLFEISQKKFFWWGSRPIWVTQWKEFQISVKKWRFEIFRTSALSRGNRVIYVLHLSLACAQNRLPPIFRSQANDRSNNLHLRVPSSTLSYDSS